MKNKVKLDRSSILTIACMSALMVLVLVLSAGARFYFRPGIDSGWWGDLALLIALVVYSLYFGINEGKNYYSKRENGRYQVAMTEFKTNRKETVKRDNEFNQWLDLLYIREKKQYFLSVLSIKGNSINPYVLDLDRHEINQLRNPFRKDWTGTEFEGRKPTIFRSLSEEQLQVVKDIFDGKISFPRLPNDYFKTANHDVAISEYKEEAESSEKNHRKMFILIAWRVGMLLLTQFIFAVFGIKVLTAGTTEEIIENLYNTMTRIINICTSFFYGFILGRIIVEMWSKTLEFKNRKQAEFLNDKDFKGISEEDLAKEEYEKYQKEIEETKENIIDPIPQLENNGRLIQ